MKLETLQLSRNMVTLLASHGITTPTPIQREIIPAIQEGRDVIAQSETGSGKTLSFAIPLIERMNKRDGLTALVLVPTRELAGQIAGEFVKFSAGRQLGITAVYGGASINDQQRKLALTNIIVGTPGRLIDMLDRGMLRLDTIRTLVLDEADRMLDMGFIRDIEKIMKRIPRERQTLMFSATMVPEIVRLSRKFLRDPKSVELASTVDADFLHQTYYQTTREAKTALLVHLLRKERGLALVFCNRKHITKRLSRVLTGEGIEARCLNGNMSQGQRERTTADYRSKQFSVLVATDVAARGLHIEDISHVYNFEIPRDVESYTHRVGRTARAGKEGEAISLVTDGEDQEFFRQILFRYRGSISLRTASDVVPLQSRGPESRGPGGARKGNAPRHAPRDSRHGRSRSHRHGRDQAEVAWTNHGASRRRQ